MDLCECGTPLKVLLQFKLLASMISPSGKIINFTYTFNGQTDTDIQQKNMKETFFCLMYVITLYCLIVENFLILQMRIFSNLYFVNIFLPPFYVIINPYIVIADKIKISLIFSYEKK